MYALVKFKDDPNPHVYEFSHVSLGPKLVTMNGVEWVSPVICDGHALEYQTEHGGEVKGDSPGDRHISKYRPLGDLPSITDYARASFRRKASAKDIETVDENLEAIGDAIKSMKQEADDDFQRGDS